MKQSKVILSLPGTTQLLFKAYNPMSFALLELTVEPESRVNIDTSIPQER